MTTTYHKKYSKKIGLANALETYIQTIVFNKTLESASFNFHRDKEPDAEVQEERMARVAK